VIEPADNAPEEQELPAGQAPPAAEPSSPETEAEQRERQIQQRLSQQGRELADARRFSQQASQALSAQTSRIAELERGIQILTANATDQARRQQAAQQQQLEAELANLPPQDRLERKIELLQQQMTGMQTAARQPQPVQQPQQPVQQREPTDEERTAYMERRVREIVGEAQQRYGTQVSLDNVPDGAWESEESFYRAVMQQAAGGDVATKKKPETTAQMRDRIRQEERERLGVNSPTAPRSASTTRRKAATEDDVRAAAQTYDSKLGPKANVERMRKLRESMG
jgi:hypothetical protein